LLRGINLVRRNRIAMAELRAALEAAGFLDVTTYVASGNIVLTSRASPQHVVADVHALIVKRFGFDISVLARSPAELAEVVRRDPLAKASVDPKRYIVTFMSGELSQEVVGNLRGVAATQERFAVIGREIYSWHPAGFARSPLWARLAAKELGVAATSRNWSTVTALLALAGDSTAR
jgi:uncharacterized protein (DUF1697 family)